jgi:hypothetical protein
VVDSDLSLALNFVFGVLPYAPATSRGEFVRARAVRSAAHPRPAELHEAVLGVNSFNRLAIPVFGLVAITIAGCTEQLQNSASCPLLCPQEGVEVQNITLEPVVVDTTVESSPGLGVENVMLLASRGDTLQTRVIARFDSTPERYHPSPVDTTTFPITVVDSAYVLLQFDSTAVKLPPTVTIEAYDVDTALTDTATLPLVQLFRPDRLIGSKQFTAAEARDSVKIPISNAILLQKIQTRKPVRIGFRAVGSSSVQMRVYARETQRDPKIWFRPSTDTSVPKVSISAYSKTPVGDPTVAGDLQDYTIVAKAMPNVIGSSLAIGGYPPKRTYLRFDIPSALIDSAGIVRATLILTQFPTRGLDDDDTVVVGAQLVAATSLITDPTRAAQILYSTGITGADSMFTVPRDSGERTLDIARVLRLWRNFSPEITPRAIILRMSGEGVRPAQARFFSMEAPASLRPKLRISYTVNTGFVLP